MIDISKDGKSSTWIITKTDSEGYHRQMNVTKDEIKELVKKAIQACFKNN
jgi:hypothetical protein